MTAGEQRYDDDQEEAGHEEEVGQHEGQVNARLQASSQTTSQMTTNEPPLRPVRRRRL